MRSSTLDSARRGYLGLTRGVVMASDDSHPVQTVDVRGLHGEYLQGVERFQQYGFNSVPLDPDENGAKGAEPLIGFVNGNRAHPVVLAENDRRTRPKNWQKGESGLWHHQGASAKFTQNGWLQDAGPNKQPHTWTCGSGTLSSGDTKFVAQVGGTKGPAAVVKNGGVYLGGDPDVLGAGAFQPVMTAAGPASNVFAKVG